MHHGMMPCTRVLLTALVTLVLCTAELNLLGQDVQTTVPVSLYDIIWNVRWATATGIMMTQSQIAEVYSSESAFCHVSPQTYRISALHVPQTWHCVTSNL
jgi:hypothetical protein